MLFVLMIFLYATAAEDNNRKSWANGILIFYVCVFVLGSCMSLIAG